MELTTVFEVVRIKQEIREVSALKMIRKERNDMYHHMYIYYRVGEQGSNEFKSPMIIRTERKKG
ncbi:hypothetical protein COJ46_22070 [Bacillus sp. AFS077874]|uniref:hypothetical protein n=1 Tax=Bacillus sp. AFS077874 TaxID=2033513 RepID=UPI000BF92BD2|nr:hypothetical protein [Bacillus sp. AFS077874]PFM75242.1 hypothetical protein COJ46_22070 [Bacillus sp. AFS077874]